MDTESVLIILSPVFLVLIILLIYFFPDPFARGVGKLISFFSGKKDHESSEKK